MLSLKRQKLCFVQWSRNGISLPLPKSCLPEKLKPEPNQRVCLCSPNQNASRVIRLCIQEDEIVYWQIKSHCDFQETIVGISTILYA